ncbi:MAG: hypothetical protein EOO01_09870 [Chitinophagaceae bacterium]|nr:MAG: hypothetical protein EOO01_09870 [Chitinophagaceae bacterium]
MVIYRVVQREKLSVILPFFATLYFVCTPQFSIYVSWASCLELFIANTSGLLSGYFLYASIRDKAGRVRILTGVFLSVCFGVVSLFTYQNGFGCFLVPFFIYLIVNPRQYKLLLLAVGLYFFIYLVYYLLFRLNLHLNEVAPNSRTRVDINVVNKIKFMYSRPLSSAFHFTYLFNEKSLAGYIIYIVILLAWAVLTFFRLRRVSITQRGMHCAIIFIFFGLMYIPSLIIKENYSSNRTLLALKMAVFFLVMESFFRVMKSPQQRKIIVAVFSVLFVVNAWFNFTKQFLIPVTYEYKALRSYIEKSYKPGVSGFHFIRPAEDFFERKYGITRSWDEFGVPSSFFDWVPEFLVRQIVYEKTGDRQLAQELVIRHWLGREAYIQSGEQVPVGGVLVDAEELMK